MEQHSPLSQGLKKRRQLLLVLPLLILPFMTLAFWALGGGQQQLEDRSGDEPAVTITGINPTVPRAKTTVGAEDKMTLYAEADREAAAAKQNRIEDWGRFGYPASMDGDSTYENVGLSASPDWDDYGTNDELDNELYDEDPNSLKVRQKLAELQAVLTRAETVHHSAFALPLARGGHTTVEGLQAESASGAKVGGQTGGQMRMRSDSGNEARLSELQYLKDMIAQSATVDGSEDTREINAMLDKILAIQHPPETTEMLEASSDAGKASSSIYPVTAVKDTMQVPLLLPAIPVGKTASGKGMIRSAETADDRNASVFYDIDTKDKKTGNETSNELGSYSNTAMAADIAKTQTLVSGGTIKMRLKTDVIIQGRLIPKGSFVYGTCRVNGERLNIDIRHIRLGDQLFPVKLTVFDLDGMEGIHIPGSITRDAAKQGADRGLTGVQMMSLDPSIAAQAASAGMEAAKGLLSKKAKLVRVTVKAGYPILLLNSNGLQ